MIKKIAKEKCEVCSARAGNNCPIVDNCHADVFRLDKEGYPYIAYGQDCDTCMVCWDDCLNNAVEVSGEIPVPFLTVY